MMIRDMFAQDINRSINGVIKVNQDKVEVIEQEVKEYVITKELKRHFISFFDYYSESFDKPTEDTGVWITGFFGSGKSHFLKMLSYILQNKVINGVPTVELFRQKFEDDPATFMLIDKSTRNQTETILFNIDIVLIKHFHQFIWGKLSSYTVAFCFDKRAELGMHFLWQLIAKVILHNKGSSALA